MIRAIFLRAIFPSLAAIVLFTACRKREDVALPDNLVKFTSTAQGITESESSIAIKVQLSRGTTQQVPVTIKLTPVGVTYGTDFTTTPAATAGELIVNVP